jgi:hypothetical protein
MNKEFEIDELLNNLSKTARKSKAPILSEDILYSATKSESKFGPRKLHTPRLLINLVGGAAVLAGIFALSMNPPQNAIMEVNLNPQLDQKISSGSFSIAMGDSRFTEEQFVSTSSVTLADWGQLAVGNYVSNNPERYEDRLWSGENAFWIFVVVDGVYIPNDGSDDLNDLLNSVKLAEFKDEITSDSSVRGIKFLIQEQAVGGALYPLVIKENPESSFYQLIRDTVLAQTYTAVPLG